MATLRSLKRKVIHLVLWLAILTTALGVIHPAAVRADDVNMSDANTYWQVATSPAAPDTTLDSTTYWAEVQAQQEYQQRQ